MKGELIKLNSGKVLICRYSPEDIRTIPRVKDMIADIHDNFPNFDKNIIWILKVTPTGNRKLSTVLKEFVKEYSDNNTFIVTMSGSIMDKVVLGKTNELLESISSEGSSLKNSGFVNLIWNRKMTRSFGNPNCFFYNSDEVKKFIENNIGEDLIINRIAE